MPAILGLTDIINRWSYTRQSVHNLTRFDHAFPEPAGAINGGRNRYWLATDIEKYERDNPKVRGQTQPWENAEMPKIEERKTPEKVQPTKPKTPQPPSRYRVFYAFGEKPPFAYREALKKAGWRYDIDRKEWLGIVKAEDLYAFDNNFAEHGGRRTHTVSLP